MKQDLFEIKENIRIAPDMYEMALQGDISAITEPGQFVNIALDGFYLRRPISVHDVDRSSGILRIIYKAVGKGTDAMACMTPGETLDVLTGLGNGFDIQRAGENTLVIGGGAGAPPMFWTAKALRDSGRNVTAIFGFNTAKEVIRSRRHSGGDYHCGWQCRYKRLCHRGTGRTSRAGLYLLLRTGANAAGSL